MLKLLNSFHHDGEKNSIFCVFDKNWHLLMLKLLVNYILSACKRGLRFFYVINEYSMYVCMHCSVKFCGIGYSQKCVL